MAGPLHDLLQLLGKADVAIACRDCRHSQTVAAGRIVKLFGERRWSTDWRAAHVRFRCSACGSKTVTLSPDFYSYSLRHQRERPGHLAAVPPALRPGLRPPPPGVSIEAWNAATERERKRLVDRARS